MKAIVWTQYGSPDVLSLEEIETPVPKDDEVLVKIHAAAANPLDWHVMRGQPFLARLEYGLFRPSINQLGADIAGQVEAVGKNVTEFRAGDAVFGSIGSKGFAEYATAAARHLALKPAHISFEAAAATPLVAFTALQGLRDSGGIQAGQRVLVNGASGGVGSCAVQIAKAFGAHVTGVTSTRNLELVRALGADAVVDYTREDFTSTGRQYDLIYCAVGNRSAFHYARALAANGRCVVAGFTSMAHLFHLLLLGRFAGRNGNRQIGIMGTAQARKDDLLTIAEMLATGKIAPVIDQRYPLSQTADALRYLETGRARGKVVISVAS